MEVKKKTEGLNREFLHNYCVAHASAFAILAPPSVVRYTAALCSRLLHKLPYCQLRYLLARRTLQFEEIWLLITIGCVNVHINTGDSLHAFTIKLHSL